MARATASSSSRTTWSATCTKCGTYGPPRQTTCRRCGSDTTWSPASGDATLITWTATPPSSKSPDTAPRTFGYVELAEGPWLETILVDIPADALREGAPLHVTFLHHPDGEPIPAFGLPRPAPADPRVSPSRAHVPGP